MESKHHSHYNLTALEQVGQVESETKGSSSCSLTKEPDESLHITSSEYVDCVQLPMRMEGDLNKLLTFQKESNSEYIAINKVDQECISLTRKSGCDCVHVGMEHKSDQHVNFKIDNDAGSVESECNYDVPMTMECITDSVLLNENSRDESDCFNCLPIEHDAMEVPTGADNVFFNGGENLGKFTSLGRHASSDVIQRDRVSPNVPDKLSVESCSEANIVKHFNSQESVKDYKSVIKMSVGDDSLCSAQSLEQDSFSLKVHTHEMTNQCLGEENASPERNISLYNKQEEEHLADRDAWECYSSQHLKSLLQQSGALTDSNHLLSVPRCCLTVELVMAAINLRLFQFNDVLAWICKICTPKNRSFKVFHCQFVQYQQLYEYFMKQVGQDQKKVWKDLFQNSIYCLPKGKGLHLIFGQKLRANKAVDIPLHDHVYTNDLANKTSSRFDWHKQFETQANLIKDMRSEINRLELELSVKNEEFMSHQENSKQEINKIRKELSVEQEKVKSYNKLKEELKLAWLVLDNQRLSIDNRIANTEEKESYLKQPCEILTDLHQMVLEKDSEISKIQENLITCQDMVKARNIIISQQQELMCKGECEMVQKEICIKRLEKEVKILENKVKERVSLIHDQQEQLKIFDMWGTINYVKQQEEQLKNLQEEIGRCNVVINQKEEKLTQMKNAAAVSESLKCQLQKDIEAAQHTIQEKDTRIQCQQSLYHDAVYDAQQKEAVAQRLNEEFNKCQELLSQKEDYIKSLTEEKSMHIVELEKRLVCCNTSLLEREDKITKLQKDLNALQKIVHEKEKLLTDYKSTFGELEVILSADSSSSGRGLYGSEAQQKHKDMESLQTFGGRITKRKLVKKAERCQPCLDYTKKNEQLRLATDKIIELEKEILYLSRQLKEDNLSTDKNRILDLKMKVSELRCCIISREQMNAQLEEQLRLQEDLTKKLRDHIVAKNETLLYFYRRCSNTTTFVGSGQENTALRMKSELSDPLTDHFSSGMQEYAQERVQEPVKQTKLELLEDSSLSQTSKDIKVSDGTLANQEPSDVLPSVSKEKTLATGKNVCHSSAKKTIKVRLSKKVENQSKVIAIRELQCMKITLSEYHERNRERNPVHENVEQNVIESCDSDKLEYTKKRKRKEMEGTEITKHYEHLPSKKSLHPENKHRILPAENFSFDVQMKNDTKECLRPNTERSNSAVREMPATSVSDQNKKKQLIHKNCKYTRCHSVGSSSASPKIMQEMYPLEIMKLKKTLEHAKTIHDKAMRKEFENILMLEGEACERERLMAQLVKDIHNLEIQLRNSDTALVIIENDRERIYALLEQVQTNLKEATRMNCVLSDLINQKDNALNASQDEIIKLNVVIKQNSEEHQKKVKELKSTICIKTVNINELKKQNDKLVEDMNKEKENLLEIIDKMKKVTGEKNNALEALKNQKDRLMKEMKEIEISQLQEKAHLEASLEEEKIKCKTLQKDYNQSEKTLMDSKANVAKIKEKQIEVEKLLKANELAAIALRDKLELMEITSAEKEAMISQLQEELNNMKLTRERQESNIQAILAEKQKFEVTLKQQAQSLSEYVQEIDQKEVICQKLQDALLSERRESELIKMAADNSLALKEQEILKLKNDKEHMEAEIQYCMNKHLAILSEKDRYWEGKLDLASKDIDEVVKINGEITNQIKDIKEAKSLIRKALRLNLTSCKSLNFRQEVNSICKLNKMIKDEKKRVTVLERKLLQEKKRNGIFKNQLQIVKQKKNDEKRKNNQNVKSFMDQICQTESSLASDLNMHIESNKNLQTALQTEKLVSEKFYEKLLLEQSRSNALATGLKQEYEETSKDLEYQLSLSCWVAEKYRDRMRRLEELSALTATMEAPGEETSP
nr:golgin subfamily B member 1-like [Cherax quadricarinatus]